MLPLPVLSVIQNWQTGILLFGKKTKAITESMAIYLVFLTGLLALGVWWGGAKGLYIMCAAYLIAMITQAAWLLIRSRSVVAQFKARDGIG